VDTPIRIPFNKPIRLDTHPAALASALQSGHLAGLGGFTKKCEAWLNAHNGAQNLIVSSATHALEMMAILMDVKPGDEVILPSFTFVSTANAFALRGATLRFADNDEYGNLSLSEVERLLTPRTKAVVAVHYAGTSCDMDALGALLSSAKVELGEDAAQALGATYKGRALGTFGSLGCYSFHETKNVSSGEGGALIVSQPERHLERAEIIREKGTNRRRFLRGQVDKYTWVDIGSSYVLSDLNCAYLWPQLEAFEAIQARRAAIWNRYLAAFAEPMKRLDGSVLTTPAWNTPNHHLFGLVFPKPELRDAFIAAMRQQGILCPFHYVPLHTSPFGRQVTGHAPEPLPHCERLSSCLVRLPLFHALTDAEQDEVIQHALHWLARQ
jgi:dTDP-4-amino-4,6-dideoxygalactose transaminase